jgi:glutamate-ammonia-ligase adenylyltransferase
VQLLVLAHSAKHPSLTKNLGNIALLRAAADLGLLDRQIAEKSRDAYRHYRKVQHALRLNGAQFARVPPEQLTAQIESVKALWSALFNRPGT